jgi:hypothetical protein
LEQEREEIEQAFEEFFPEVPEPMDLGEDEY